MNYLKKAQPRQQKIQMYFYWAYLYIALLIFLKPAIAYQNIKRIRKNQQAKLHEHNLLVFYSEGSGYLEVQDCFGRETVISLSQSPNYPVEEDDYIKMERTQNNLFFFNYTGVVYLHSRTKGYVLMRWRNIDPKKGIGYGYNYIKPSSFSIQYNEISEKISASINPLEVSLKDRDSLLQIFQVRFRVVLARDLRALKDGLYCSKGSFMQGGITIKDSKIIYAGQQFNITIDSISNLLKNFNKPEKLFVGVKAEIELLWLKSDVVEKYRFYYNHRHLVFSDYLNKNNRKNRESNRRSIDVLDLQQN